MTEHVASSRIEGFCQRVLPLAELVSVAEHLKVCQTCHQLFVKTLRQRKSLVPFRLDLSQAAAVRHEHLEYEQLADYADDSLDETEHEMLDLHLEQCAGCREDLQSFLEFRRELEAEIDGYRPEEQPEKQEPGRRLWWRWAVLQPVYAALLILIGAAIVLSLVVLRRSSSNEPQQARNTNLRNISPEEPRSAATVQEPSPSPVLPEKSATTSPARTSAPKQLLAVKPQTMDNRIRGDSAEIALNDGSGRIMFQKNGIVTGLDDAPADTKREVAEAITSLGFQRPQVSELLAPESSALRGSAGRELSFKLLSPARKVIVEDKPQFKWESVPGASSYSVYVQDTTGGEVAKSESLPADSTSWSPAAGLKRGKLYSWSVVARVNGKDVVSPNAAAPEVRFQIISPEDLKTLNLLRREKSHLALGVFYVRTGLIAEAESEFRKLVQLNPDSELARSLYRSVKSVMPDR